MPSRNSYGIKKRNILRVESANYVFQWSKY